MKNNQSFTLIELLITIAIIVILATMSLVIFNRKDYEKTNNDRIRSKDINEIANALEEFKADHGHYPYVNWHTGVHGAQAVLNLNPSDCVGTTDYYMLNYAEEIEFEPGTQIVFNNSSACDDLSLQLLGLGYLKKMSADPNDTTVWETSGSNLRAYLTKMPKDPLNNEITCAPGAGCKAELDYTATENAGLRYWYNSYYKCDAENIGVGGSYWLNAITQTKKDHDLNSTNGLYYYELGNINEVRQPGSYCGDT